MDHIQFSKSSIVPSSGSGLDGVCRICHSKEEPDSPLISPCYCTGSIGYVHNSCLQQWIKSSETTCCEICKFDFIMRKKIKPFRKLEKLQMPPSEQVKLRHHIIFHVVAITCVVWFLCMLIMRNPDKIDAWSICERLVILFIAISEIAFICIHCDMYEQLFRRWWTFITVINVQNMPDKGNVMQQQQREPAAFLADSKLTTSVQANEDNKQLPLDEDEFRSCQIDGSNRNYSSVNVDHTKMISDKISVTEMSFSLKSHS